MSSHVYVTGETIADVWEQSLRALLSIESPIFVDSLVGGPSIEARAAMLRVKQPTLEPRVSDAYVDPELIESYSDLLVPRTLANADDAVRTIADRIYRFPTSSSDTLDQYASALKELRRDPQSRRAIIQIWDPPVDLSADGRASPSGHCFLQFLARDGVLDLAAASRSVDAWLGAVPNMLAFVGLQEKAAARLKLKVGSYSHMIVSYHIYVRDIPLASNALS